MFAPFGLLSANRRMHTAQVFVVVLALSSLSGSVIDNARLLAQEGTVAGTVTPAATPAATSLADLTKTVFNTPRYAVVLGINDYADDGINDLELCEKDAQAVYNLLIDPAIGGVPKDNATLLLGDKATTSGIRRALSPLAQIPQQSVVFVYYSGHGMKQGDEAFWVTQDALKDDLAGTALSDTDVQLILKRIPSDRVIVMIDACYASATAKGNKAVDVSASLKKFTGKGRAILSAAGDGEEAIEAADLEHSVFTYYLLKGLRGEADANADGVLVLPEITNYLDEKVADAARARKGVQRPVVDLAGVQEPAKFSVVIDTPRLQALASAMAKAQLLRTARTKALRALALDDALTVDQFKEAQQLLEIDPTKLSKQQSLLLLEYGRVLDGELPVTKLTKALALARASSGAIAPTVSTTPTVSTPRRQKRRLSPTQPVTAPVVVKFTGTKAGDRTELTGLKIPFRWCPSGAFTMGTPGATNDEAPVSVTLSSGFWLGETEATQVQWTTIMKTTPWSGEARVKTGPDYPATQMNWDEAVAYCKKLTEQERAAGRLPVAWQYALPTEAQWEYACRAGTTTPYCFGESDSRLGDYGWFGKNADNAGEQYAHRVGLKLANPWGLRDMHGNVHEWCQDWYVEKLAGGRDPSGPAQGTSRVLRDGSWNARASVCRSACRQHRQPDRRSNPLGFRVAVVPTRQ